MRRSSPRFAHLAPFPGRAGALFLIAGIVGPSIGARPAAGQAAAQDSVVSLDALTVIARREFGLVGGASAIIFSPQRMNLPPIASVEEALRDVPFVLVRQNSRGQAEISLRGSESRQVAVLVDGVPLTLAWDARTDPSVIPLQGAERLEVVRGLSSLLSGPNVLGGIVNVSVGRGRRADPIDPAVRWTSGVDHEGGYSLGGSFAEPLEVASGFWTFRGGAGWRSRSGVSLPGNVDDPGATDELRSNSYFDQFSGFGSISYQTMEGRWASISASAQSSDRGVPPELHVSDPRLWQYPEDRSGFLNVSLGADDLETPWGSGGLELNMGVHGGRQEIESFSSLAYETLDGTEVGEGRTFTARLSGDHSLGERGELKTAFTFAAIGHSETVDDAPADDYGQRLWSLATETDWSIGERARLALSGALDGAETVEAGGREPLAARWAPAGRVGLTLPLEGRPVVLHLSASSRARFPALRELYSGALGRFQPNPELGPERLFAVEAGATFERGGLDLQAVAFHQLLDDAVVRTTTPEGQFLRVNQNELTTTGVELLMGFEAGRFEMDGDVTLQRVRLSTPDGSGRPEHMPQFRSGFDIEVPFLDDYLAWGRMEYRGQMFCIHPDSDAEIPLDARARADISIERDFQLRNEGRLSSLKTRVSMDNAFDSAIYDQCGMPQPGRTFSVGIELR